MKSKGISLDPQQVSESVWFYDGHYSLCLVHEIRDAAGNYIRTDEIKLPWKKLIVSAKRCRPQDFK